MRDALSAAAAAGALARGVADALPIVLDAALKGAALVGAAAVAAWLLRRRSAAARHAAWTAAVVAHLTLPALTLLTPQWRIPILPAPPWVVAGDVSAAAAGSVLRVRATSTAAPGGSAAHQHAAGLPSAPTVAPNGSRPNGQGSALDSATGLAPRPTPAGSGAPSALRGPSLVGPSRWGAGLWATGVWVAGALLVLVRLALGTWRVARLARAGVRVDDGAWLALAQRIAARLGVRRPLTLLRGDRLGVPVTWGVVYPAVLLPPDADGWPEARRRFVLVHELAHVRRFDALTQLLAQGALTLFWFDPLVWLAARRMRAERERACDDVVLGDGTPASAYAGALLDLVRALGAPARDRAAPAFAALAMARPSELEGRLLAILDPALDRRTLSRRGTLMTALAVALVALPLAALRPFQVPRPPGTPAPEAAPPGTTIVRTADGRTADGRITRTTTVTRQSAPDERATGVVRGAAAGRGDTLAAVWPAPPTAPTPPIPPQQAATRIVPPASVTPVAPPAPSGGPGRASGLVTCDDGLRNRGGAFMWVTDNSGGRVVTYVANAAGRCAAATIVGRVTFAADDRDVASVAPGAVATFRERTAAADRVVRVTRAPGGGVQREAFADGHPAPDDAAARAWLADFLPEVLREAPINAPERVARLRAHGGVEAVLAEVGRIRSSGAKRAHYEALLDGGRLSPGDVERIARQAERDGLAPGDLRGVVERLSAGATASPGAPAAVADAVGRIPASGDRVAALTALVPGADRDLLLSLAEAAKGIEASGDRAEFLRAAAPRYLTPRDDALRRAYFTTAATVPASGDLREVLVAALGYGSRDPAVTAAALDAAQAIAASGDRADVLVAAARRGLLGAPVARTAYLRAARTIASGDDYRRAMEAMLPP